MGVIGGHDGNVTEDYSPRVYLEERGELGGGNIMDKLHREGSTILRRTLIS